MFVFVLALVLLWWRWCVAPLFGQRFAAAVIQQQLRLAIPHALIITMQLTMLVRWYHDTMAVRGRGLLHRGWGWGSGPEGVVTKELHVAVELTGTHTRGMTVADLREEVFPPDRPKQAIAEF